MEQGHVEDMIITQAVKSGLPIPDRIENAPSIWPGLELYYIGFLNLTSSRQVGFQMGPIPWLSIEQYCRLQGLDEDQAESMHFHVSEMDKFYLKYQNKKAKK